MPAKRDKEQLEELLSAYIDGECSPAERARVEKALEADPQLRGRLAQLRQVVQLVHSVESEPAPEHLRQRILAQLERRSLLGDLPERPTVARPPRLWVRAGLAAAICLLAVGAGWWIYRASVSGVKPMRDRARQFAAVEQRESAPAVVGEPSAADRSSYEAAGGPEGQPPPEAVVAAPAAKQQAFENALAERTDRSGPAEMRRGGKGFGYAGAPQTQPVVSDHVAAGTVAKGPVPGALARKVPGLAAEKPPGAARPVPGVLEVQVVLEDRSRFEPAIRAVTSVVELLGGRVTGMLADADSRRVIARLPQARAAELASVVRSLPSVVEAHAVQRQVAEPASQMVAVAMAQQWLTQARDAVALLARPATLEERIEPAAGAPGDKGGGLDRAFAEARPAGHRAPARAASRGAATGRRARSATAGVSAGERDAVRGAPAGLSAGITRARVLTRSGVLAGVPATRPAAALERAGADVPVVVVLQAAAATQPSE